MKTSSEFEKYLKAVKNQLKGPITARIQYMQNLRKVTNELYKDNSAFSEQELASLLGTPLALSLDFAQQYPQRVTSLHTRVLSCILICIAMFGAVVFGHALLPRSESFVKIIMINETKKQIEIVDVPQGQYNNSFTFFGN